MNAIESLQGKYRKQACSFLYRLLYVGILAVMMLFCFPDLLDISDVYWRHIAVLLVTSTIFSAACLLCRRQQIYVAALGFCVFLFLFLSIGSERCLLYFREVLNLSSAESLLSAENSFLMDVGVNRSGDPTRIALFYIELGRVFLLTVVCCLVQPLLGKNNYLKIIFADVVGGRLIYMRQVPKMGVISFILYIALVAAEWARARWKSLEEGNVQTFEHGASWSGHRGVKMKNENTQTYIVYILPFPVIYAVFLCFMPMQEEPYDWQWAKNAYLNAQDKLTMYTENLWNSGNEYFGGATSGFSGESGLFADIMKNDGQLMRLGIGRQRTTSVYLAGKVYDSFNGREWENRRGNSGTAQAGTRDGGMSDISESERILDAMETMYALSNYTENLDQTFYRNVWMDVTYQYFHTNYLMAPSKTWAIEDEGKKIKYHYNGGNLLFNKKAGYGTEYTVNFCQLDIEREELYRFLEWNQIDDVDAWRKTVRQYIDESVPIEELYAYREMMKEHYLTETDLSSEVEAWLASVTAEAKTDVEKLKCIESALFSMEYSTSPGELPDTVTDEGSFLDYFLLEKREGYCVHFATAFVLLARAEGFPARYVQGFCIPVVRGDETPVYSDMAHAWPEVYIDGKGWIPFEPTPGFAINRNLPETEDTDSDGSAVYTSGLESGIQDDIPELGLKLPEESIVEETIPEEQEHNRILPHLVRAVCILLFGSALVLIFDWVWEKYRESKRGLVEKYRFTVWHNLQILGLLGYGRQPAETYHELAERIRQGNISAGKRENAGKEEDSIEGEKGGNEVSCKFIETYEKHLYGTLEIDEQILKGVLAEKEQLLETLKKCKRRAYLFYRVKLYIARYR